MDIGVKNEEKLRNNEKGRGSRTDEDFEVMITLYMFTF